MELHKKIAVVTGASRGLGAAISETLTKKGVRVYGLSRNKNSLDKQGKKLGENFTPVVLDISNNKAVEEWISTTFSEKLKPDIIINNAGAGGFGKIDEIPAHEWLTMINTNLNGMYFITSRLVSFMKQKKESSHIINIGSVLGTTTRAESAAYSTTKYGVQGFSEALFKELRLYNIKVTCLNPGSIDTGFFKSSGIESHQNMLQPKDIAKTVVHILETPDNMLINSLSLRSLNPKKPEK